MRQQKERKRLSYYSGKKLKKILLVAAVVLIAGGIFGGGWFLGTRPSPPESSITSPEAPPRTKLPPSSYLPEVPRISAEEVKAKWDAGANIVIIDARSKDSYDQSHIVGAISIQTMAEPYSNLGSYDEIIAYCY